jgi:molybdopterin-guanine dinucleotide biosynthesis protein B
LIPILLVVGRPNVGKTTFIETLIPELVRRGYRVATIKHSTHNFEMDQEGKDSWRHQKAGAHSTFIVSPHKIAMIEQVEKDFNPEELRDRYIKNVDLILAEGFKKQPYPKIEVVRREIHPEPITSKDKNLVAFVGDKVPEGTVPYFQVRDIEKIGDLIENRFLKTLGKNL